MSVCSEKCQMSSEKKHFHYTWNAFYLRCVLTLMLCQLRAAVQLCHTPLCGSCSHLLFVIDRFNPMLMLFDLNIALISSNQ